VRVLARGGFQRRDDHVLDLVEQDGRRPTGPRLVDQTVQPPLDETGSASGSPTARSHRVPLLIRPAIRAPQHDPRAHSQELHGLRALCPTRQLSLFVIAEHQLRLAPARPRLIRKSGHPPGSKPRPPLPHRIRGYLELRRHTCSRLPVRARQDDACPIDKTGRHRPARPAQQLGALLIGQHDFDGTRTQYKQIVERFRSRSDRRSPSHSSTIAGVQSQG
jgi:hypothetical protein